MFMCRYDDVPAPGGYDGSDFLSSIEHYNVSEDRWTEEGNMACGRSGHGVAVGAEPSHEYVCLCHYLAMWNVGRGQWVMHDGMQYDPIHDQGQGHKPFNVGNLAVFKSNLARHLQWELTTDQN